MPKISVVIPIYNTENYLEECIDSVLSQTFTDFEIILVNDGSLGNADEICNEYIKKDSRIKYISKKNEGAAIARNVGISNATGEIIYCVDSDDTIKETFLDDIYDAFEDSGCDFLAIGPFINNNLELLGCIPTWAFAVKKEFLDKYPDVRFQEGFMPCEDGLFSHKLMALTNKIAKCDSDGYNYRKNPKSSEHNLNCKKMLRDIPKWFDVLTDFYNKYDLWETHKTHLLCFVQNEPFGRLNSLNFSLIQKIILSKIILSFVHKNNLLNNSRYELLNHDFQIFLKSKSYLDYLLRITLDRKYNIYRINNVFNFKLRTNKKKLLLIDNDYLVNGHGGVEHVLCNMANVMDNAGMDVVVATMDEQQGGTFYKLNKNVRFYNTYQNLKILYKIKKLFTKKENIYKLELTNKSKIWNKFIKKYKPDVIICFSLPTLLDVTYKKEFNIPVILTVHGRPINDYTNRFWPRPDYMNNLLENTYKKADVVQVLLDSYQQTVPKSFEGEIITIANIAPYGDYTINYDNNGQKKIVCIASLDERKHQDILINSFSSIANDYSDWILELWGCGYKKDEYEKLIKDNKMEDRIFLRGTTKTPKNVLKNTDIFALPSTCEGWPLVLGESMSMGIPCIGLEICDGVNEIIRQNENGVLSKNSVEDFSVKLKSLMDSSEFRKSLGLQAQKDMQNYTENIIWNKWIKLITGLLKDN